MTCPPGKRVVFLLACALVLHLGCGMATASLLTCQHAAGIVPAAGQAVSGWLPELPTEPSPRFQENQATNPTGSAGKEATGMVPVSTGILFHRPQLIQPVRLGDHPGWPKDIVPDAPVFGFLKVPIAGWPRLFRQGTF